MPDQILIQPSGPGSEPEKEGDGGQKLAEDVRHLIEEMEDVTDTIKAAIDEKQRYKAPTCCGHLPCKGRTPGCFHCDLCLDCITGAGCGHGDSDHRPNRGLVQ